MDKQTPEKKQLQSEVADKYELTGVPVGTFDFNGYGRIDLTKMGLAEADALVAAEFPFLVEKKKEAKVKALPTASAS